MHPHARKTPARRLGCVERPRSGTEQEFRSNFEQEDGATQGVRTMSGKTLTKRDIEVNLVEILEKAGKPPEILE